MKSLLVRFECCHRFDLKVAALHHNEASVLQEAICSHAKIKEIKAVLNPNVLAYTN